MFVNLINAFLFSPPPHLFHSLLLCRLKVLVEECSTQDKTIYALPPQDDQMPDAAQAWQKIEQVYGKGAMGRYVRQPTERVYMVLANDQRVRNLLTSKTPGQSYNSIIVEVGEVLPGSDEAKELLKGYAQMKSRTKGKKKKWAQEFRKRINSYVYRSGNGDLPQTWPLIRKVQLKGPWSVLNTGAVLVDLPGVRDSNAARAKVAESYLQNCNQIAIVAPIKRAGEIVLYALISHISNLYLIFYYPTLTCILDLS